MRKEEKRKAIEMRLAGEPYEHIKSTLGISKSTLSGWFKNIALTKEQLERIRGNATAKRVETYIKTTKERRKRIFNNFCEEEKKNLFPLSKRDLLMAGLFLYLGEGAKSDWWRINISNSDPSIIKFSTFWFTKILGIKKDKLKVQLHLYNDMDAEKEIEYWKNVMDINRDQFVRPYIKKTSSQRIDHPSFGHGTCNVYTCDVKLKHKIMAGIRVILEEVNNGPVV